MLLRAADIVEPLSHGELDMRFFCHYGSPACVLGHYTKVTNIDVLSMERAEEHFGLRMENIIMLFGIEGCINAKTGKQAAKYIRDFVKRNSKPQSQKANVKRRQGLIIK